MPPAIWLSVALAIRTHLRRQLRRPNGFGAAVWHLRGRRPHAVAAACGLRRLPYSRPSPRGARRECACSFRDQTVELSQATRRALVSSAGATLGLKSSAPPAAVRSACRDARTVAARRCSLRSFAVHGALGLPRPSSFLGFGCRDGISGCLGMASRRGCAPDASSPPSRRLACPSTTHPSTGRRESLGVASELPPACVPVGDGF